MYSSCLSILVFYVAIVKNVHCWGEVGHGLVVRLAQSQLTEKASAWVESLIPRHFSENLTSVAVWADNILYPDTNPFGHQNWQWSRPLHYINVPSEKCDYDSSRDCIADICIDGALKNYSKRVINANLDYVQHQEALMFLVHYVGDVHQPLHVGFVEDRGGNSVTGYFMNQTVSTNLHSLWDSELIRIRLMNDYGSNITQYYQYLHSLMLKQNSTNSDDGDVNQWIRESLKLVCQQVYFDESNMTMNATTNFKLGHIYYARNIETIEKRLVQGGWRLSVLLNRLGADSSLESSGYTIMDSSLFKLTIFIFITSTFFSF